MGSTRLRNPKIDILFGMTDLDRHILEDICMALEGIKGQIDVIDSCLRRMAGSSRPEAAEVPESGGIIAEPVAVQTDTRFDEAVVSSEVPLGGPSCGECAVGQAGIPVGEDDGSGTLGEMDMEGVSLPVVEDSEVSVDPMGTEDEEPAEESAGESAEVAAGCVQAGVEADEVSIFGEEPVGAGAPVAGEDVGGELELPVFADSPVDDGGEDAPAGAESGEKETAGRLGDAAVAGRNYGQPVFAWRTDRPGSQVRNILSAISLNDRMMFIRTLFGDDPALFQRTISVFNSISSLAEAEAYIRSHFKDWDMGSDEVYRFMMAARRRFV